MAKKRVSRKAQRGSRGRTKATRRTKNGQTRRQRRDLASKPPPRTTSRLSSTMLIPVDEVLEDLATQRLCYLDVECEGVPELRVPLAEKDVVIGRSRSCDLALPIPSVSTRHARVGCRGEEFYVEDLGSTNGTYVNGVRVQRCILYSNDVIRAGSAKLHFIQHKIRRET